MRIDYIQKLNLLYKCRFSLIFFHSLNNSLFMRLFDK